MEKGLKAVSLTSAIYCKSDKANVTICHCPPCGYIYLLLIYIYIYSCWLCPWQTTNIKQTISCCNMKPHRNCQDCSSNQKGVKEEVCPLCRKWPLQNLPSSAASSPLRPEWHAAAGFDGSAQSPARNLQGCLNAYAKPKHPQHKEQTRRNGILVPRRVTHEHILRMPLTHQLLLSLLVAWWAPTKNSLPGHAYGRYSCRMGKISKKHVRSPSFGSLFSPFAGKPTAQQMAAQLQKHPAASRAIRMTVWWSSSSPNRSTSPSRHADPCLFFHRRVNTRGESAGVCHPGERRGAGFGGNLSCSGSVCSVCSDVFFFLSILPNPMLQESQKPVLFERK